MGKEIDVKHEFKSPMKIILWGIIYTVGCFSFGYSMGVYNVLFEKFYNKHKEDYKGNYETLIGFVNGFLMFGAIIGSFTGSFFINKFGAFKTEIVRNLLIIIGLLTYINKNIYFIYFTRFIVGFMCGLSNVTISTLWEDNIPSYYKTFLGSFMYFWITIGIIVSNIWGIIFKDNIASYYVFILLFPIIIDSIRLIIFYIFFKFESPFWIYNNDKDNYEIKIKNYFSFIYKDEYIDKNYNIFITDLKKLKNNNNDNGNDNESFLSKSYRKQLVIGILLNILNQLTGVNCFILYSEEIFKQFGSYSNKLTLGVSLFNWFSSLFLMFFNEKFGKRFSILYGLFTLSSGILFFCYGLIFDIKIIQPIGIFIFIFHFGISVGGNLYPYVASILPPNGLSFTLGIQWIFTAIISIFSAQLIKIMKLELFLIFAIIGFLGFLYLYFNMIEIKGIDKGEIFERYNKNNKKNNNDYLLN